MDNGSSQPRIPRSLFDLMTIISGVEDDALSFVEAAREIVNREVAPGAKTRDQLYHHIEALVPMLRIEDTSGWDEGRRQAQSTLLGILEERTKEQQRAFNELFLRLGEGGLLAPSFPAPYGLGLPQNVADAVWMLVAMADEGLSTSMGASMILVGWPVLQFGTKEQQNLYLPRLTAGQLRGAFCLTEPHGGTATISDTKTTWERDGDSYVLNGVKRFITNGDAGRNGLYLVYANHITGGARGTTFLVPGEHVDGTLWPGLKPGWPENKMGIRSSPTTEVYLNDVRIPVSFRLGEENQGRSIILETLDNCRPFVEGQSKAAAMVSLQRAESFLRSRLLRKRPLSESELRQHVMGEDFARTVVMALAERGYAEVVHNPNRPVLPQLRTLFSGCLKLVGARNGIQVAQNCAKAMGGQAFMEDEDQNRTLRATAVYDTYEGAHDAMVLMVAARGLETLIPMDLAA